MEQEGTKVELYIYDLSQGLARQLSVQFLGKALDGIWHTAVGVYGKEYYFGGGLQNNPIGQSSYGNPVQVMLLGHTQIPQDIFEEYLQEIQPRYTQETYSLMRHNCNNFSEEVSQFLLGTGIPEYILRLPEEVLSSPMGVMLMPMIENLDATLRQGQVPMPQQITSPQPMPNFSNIELPSSVNLPSVTSKEASAVQLTSAGSIHSVNASETPHVVPPVSISSAPTTLSLASSNSNPEEKQQTGATSPSLQHSAKDPLGNARAQVQEEITREFAQIMASGSLKASEAAALAARRVLERHGMAASTVPSF
jgi:hypothetical protein